MEEKKVFLENKITLINRKQFSITGVQKVVSVKENEIVLKVANSGFVLSGTSLQVTKLEVASGIMEVSGLIDSMRYTTASNKQNFFKRILK